MNEQIKRKAITVLNKFIETKENDWDCEVRIIDTILNYEELGENKIVEIKYHALVEHDIYRGRIYYNHTKNLVDIEFLKMY